MNQFADATGDHQWIHVDVERAKAESPFGGPIAHGYLTLSLLIPMYSEVLVVSDATMGVNYGLNKVRFPAPVPVGAKVRLTATLKDVEEVAGGLQVTVAGVIEAEGGEQAGLHRRAGLPRLRLSRRAPGVQDGSRADGGSRWRSGSRSCGPGTPRARRPPPRRPCAYGEHPDQVADLWLPPEDALPAEGRPPARGQHPRRLLHGALPPRPARADRP